MKTACCCLVGCLCLLTSYSQKLERFGWEPSQPLTVSKLFLPGDSIPVSFPIFSLELDNDQIDVNSNWWDRVSSDKKIKLDLAVDNNFKQGVKIHLDFINKGNTPLKISNIIPFSRHQFFYQITGIRLADTSRSFLFQPGLEPIGVIVPHNNNDLNFTAVELKGNRTLFGLLKRSQDTIQNYLQNRMPYLLQPGKTISFDFYADVVDGDWHEALRKCFQERMLYEVDHFDNSLYERKDLDYIRHAYTMHLMMAWEKNYYSTVDSSYHLKEFLEKMKGLYGGDDIFTIWPTWPALGLDQRSQWKLMEDLPGGLPKQKELASLAHSLGGKYFISYNPWDDADEKSSMEKMSAIIHEINADGVVLDTKAEASKALQDAADKAKPGVVLYSEGMAVPKDMQGIISGRVHNDIYYPPLLNLNKLIKPDFAIFRVIEVARERVRREYSSALFNGYGVEINVMREGRPGWIDEDYRYWGRCVRILRENTKNFNSMNWLPLVPTIKDKIYVNKWPGENKTVYTIFNLRPEGFNDALFELKPSAGEHVIDLWNHEEVAVKIDAEKSYAVVDMAPFDPKWLDTNNEGSVSAVAVFPKALLVHLDGDRLSVEASRGSQIRIWQGNPSYQGRSLNVDAREASLHLFKQFGRVEGKYVIQLFDNGDLLDEYVLMIPTGKPLLVSETTRTIPASSQPAGMVKIPAGEFTMTATSGDEFIAYPKDNLGKMQMKSFWMDKYPVTNRQFKEFVDRSGYHPSDTVNYLRHWVNGSPKVGEQNFPVVNISYEDAKAYAAWAGKRLPTEVEWQYAAQTSDGRNWPWGNEVKEKAKDKKTISATLTLVDYGTPDPKYCNIGDGKLYPVGKYKKGANPFGLLDLVGSVWQLTNDWYQNDSYQYIILKGGSYYKPGGSWWYVQGGPKPLPYRQMLLRVSQGFERNATVGFRCVKDAD